MVYLRGFEMGFLVTDPSGNVELTYPAPLSVSLCERCCGLGYDEYVTVRGDDLTELCGACNGTGIVETCPECGQRPDGQTDACLCTFNPARELAWAAQHTDWLRGAS
jgi:RecJ-like exonuclease